MPEFISMTIGDWLDKKAQEYPDKDCSVHPLEGLRFTTSEFQAEVNRVARGLMAMGIQKGDHVAIWATNYPQWVQTQFATAKIGAVLVTVNTNYKKYELEYLLKQSDSKMLIMMGGTKDNNYVDHIYAVCPELNSCEPGALDCKKLPFLKTVVFLDEEKHPGMYNWSDVLRLSEMVTDEERAERQASCDPHDVINMQYTSGTTGFPKGVMLTHYNLINNGKIIGESMAFSDKDRLCITVPLFHCFGCVLGVMASITNDTTMVFVDHFNPVNVLKVLDLEKCTAFHGVPTMFIAELDHPRFGEFDLGSLRTGIMAGSPCPVEVMKQVQSRMHMEEVTICYGMTETSPVSTQNPLDDTLERRVGTVGRVHPHLEVKVVEPETGAVVPLGQPGELCTRGYSVMLGYWDNAEATAAAIDRAGWMHTGDLATMDAEGYVKIVGRIKDMIIRGGENVYPREVEEFLHTHPDISEAQVIGVPSVKYGEEVMAWVRLKSGASLTAEVLVAFCAGRISTFKIPRHWKFVDSFPMTVTGKVQKFRMREVSIAELGLGDVASLKTA